MRRRILGSLTLGLSALAFQTAQAQPHYDKPNPPSTTAQKGVRPGGEKHRPSKLSEPNRQKFVAKYDTNHDGKLDADELAAAKWALAAYRAKHNLKELSAADRERLEPLESLLQELDANGDGKLDAAELKILRQRLEERRDRPDSRESDEQARVRAARRSEFVKQHDTNGDGKLDPAERAKTKTARSAQQEHHEQHPQTQAKARSHRSAHAG